MTKEYVISGAKLECTNGSKPSSLVVLESRSTQFGMRRTANVADAAPGVNIFPFGVCKATSSPCTPACARWNGGKSNFKNCGEPALMVGDSTLCVAGGGVIEVKDSGQRNITFSDTLNALGIGQMNWDKESEYWESFGGTGGTESREERIARQLAGLRPNERPGSAEAELQYWRGVKADIVDFWKDALEPNPNRQLERELGLRPNELKPLSEKQAAKIERRLDKYVF